MTEGEVAARRPPVPMRAAVDRKLRQGQAASRCCRLYAVSFCSANTKPHQRPASTFSCKRSFCPFSHIWEKMTPELYLSARHGCVYRSKADLVHQAVPLLIGLASMSSSLPKCCIERRLRGCMPLKARETFKHDRHSLSPCM